jgi:hypothetical protein
MCDSFVKIKEQSATVNYLIRRFFASLFRGVDVLVLPSSSNKDELSSNPDVWKLQVTIIVQAASGKGLAQCQVPRGININSPGFKQTR